MEIVLECQVCGTKLEVMDLSMPQLELLLENFERHHGTTGHTAEQIKAWQDAETERYRNSSEMFRRGDDADE